VVNDIFPDELLNLGRSDGGKGLSFNPLGEIIYCDEDVFTLTRSFGKRAKYIRAPSSKL